MDEGPREESRPFFCVCRACLTVWRFHRVAISTRSRLGPSGAQARDDGEEKAPEQDSRSPKRGFRDDTRPEARGPSDNIPLQASARGGGRSEKSGTVVSSARMDIRPEKNRGRMNLSILAPS